MGSEAGDIWRRPDIEMSERDGRLEGTDEQPETDTTPLRSDNDRDSSDREHRDRSDHEHRDRSDHEHRDSESGHGSDHHNHSHWAFNRNRYATRKTAAQGMMDMALMLANASQLKSVLQEGPSHEHYSLLLFLIIFSISLQIFTGIVLLIVGAMEVKYNETDISHKKADKWNNFSVALVFLITVTNIFITSFGINGSVGAVTSSGHGSGTAYNGIVTSDGSLPTPDT